LSRKDEKTKKIVYQFATAKISSDANI